MFCSFGFLQNSGHVMVASSLSSFVVIFKSIGDPVCLCTVVSST